MANDCNVEPLSIISLNTNGLGGANKLRSVTEWLKTFHKAESKILFLQETHTTPKTEKLWEDLWDKCEVKFSHGESASKGVAIMIPKQMNYTINETILSNNGRYIALIITIDGNKFCLINCYAPTVDKAKEQLKWLAEIQLILDANSEKNIIIGGDLNDVFIPRLDRYRCKPNAPETEYVKAWKSTCEELNLIDVWRTLNPETKRYTWRQGSSATRLKQSRLDYWLVSVHMMYDLDIVDILSSSRSDHSMITIDFFKSDIPQRGPSFWRFNASLLKDADYVKIMDLLVAHH
jgi:exodeoxyribonuclease-3